MMDTILLLILKRILLCVCSYGRIFLGATFGALATCVVTVFLQGRPYLQFLLFHGVVNMLMLRVGLDIRKGRELLKGWVFLYIGAFLMGGILHIFQPYLRTGGLFALLTVISYYLVRGIWELLLGLAKRTNYYCEVELFLGKQSYKTKALIDTGNTLRDMVSKEPVNVVEKEVAKTLMAGEHSIKIRYIPFHSIGKADGLMMLIRLDRMKILEGEHEKWIEHPLAAISEEKLSEENYQVILNPEILAGGKENGDKSSSSTSVQIQGDSRF